VGLTKNGRAESLVDEIASIPLDLWTLGASTHRAIELDAALREGLTFYCDAVRRVWGGDAGINKASPASTGKLSDGGLFLGI
jgi:hypothetical protein